MNLKARYGQTYRIARADGGDRTGPKRPRPPIRRFTPRGRLPVVAWSIQSDHLAAASGVGGLLI